MSERIKRFSIRFFTCLLTAFMVFMSLVVSADVDIKESTEGILSVNNENFTLSLNEEDGILILEDKKNGAVWSSNPSDAKDDELATGIVRTNLRSQLLVCYVDGFSRAWTNNLSSSILAFGTTFTVKGNTIRADYDFVDEGFMIPVEYSLTENGLKANVILDEIREYSECKINEIQLLPFFGACGVEENGYMFVPDGSGAIIECNNGKTNLDIYSKALYGGEQTLTPQNKVINNQNIILPLFGMKKGDNAFAAIITKGASNARIEAAVAGKLCGYNRIYSSVIYRECNTIELTNTSGSDNVALFVALNETNLKEYEVSYNFLDKANANYTGMASVMREELKVNGLEENRSEQLPLFVDFYGAVKKEKAFLGIRYAGIDTLTDFDDAKNILSDIKDNGINAVTVGYRNINKAHIFGKIGSKVSPLSKLGGKSGYNKLCEFANKNGIKIYPYGDFVSFSKGGNGYNTLFDAAFSLDLSVSKRYPYSVVTNTQDNTKNAIYLVKPSKYKTALNALIKSLDKLKSDGVYFDESVNTVYSNFAKNGYQRDRAEEEMVKIYKRLAKKDNGILMSEPNAYALAFASEVTDLPLNSSGNMLFDYDVPALQIALSGVVPYSSTALNINGYSMDDILRHIESGSGIKFALIESNGRKLLHTDLDYLYAATYDTCKDEINDLYKKISEVYEKTEGSSIISHTRKGELVRVDFKNGCTVYINYGESEVNVDMSTVVEGESFVVLKDGEQL